MFIGWHFYFPLKSVVGWGIELLKLGASEKKGCTSTVACVFYLLYHVCNCFFCSYVWFSPRHPLDFASCSRLSTSIVSTMIPLSASPSYTPEILTDPGHMSRTQKAVPWVLHFIFSGHMNPTHKAVPWVLFPSTLVLEYSFVFTCSFTYFLYICLGISSVFILGSYPFLALVLVSPSAFISFNVPLCRNILGPSFSDPFPRV